LKEYFDKPHDDNCQCDRNYHHNSYGNHCYDNHKCRHICKRKCNDCCYTATIPNTTTAPNTNTNANNSIQLELNDQFKTLINATTGSHVINIQRPNSPNKIFNIAKSSPGDSPTINYVMAVGEQDSKIELRWDNVLEIRLTNNINSGIYTINWL
jgi:hypothetical protein